MEALFDVSAVALALFSVPAAIDGIYLHLWKFRLHARPETEIEHGLHTLHAILFVPMLVLLLAGHTAGLLLWLGIAAVLANLAIIVWDVLEERSSRLFQGGLPQFELVLHVVVVLLQAAAIALSVAARPEGAWALDAVATAEQLAAAQSAYTLVHFLLPGSIAMVALHVALMPAIRRACSVRVPQTPTPSPVR
jgi:hypothetical protein